MQHYAPLTRCGKILNFYLTDEWKGKYGMLMCAQWDDIPAIGETYKGNSVVHNNVEEPQGP